MKHLPLIFTLPLAPLPAHFGGDTVFVRKPNLDALMRDSDRFKNAQIPPSGMLVQGRDLMEVGQ